jgi:hypothetical protein
MRSFHFLASLVTTPSRALWLLVAGLLIGDRQFVSSTDLSGDV